MTTEWYLERYLTGKETGSKAAADGKHFGSFGAALAELKKRRTGGAEIVRIMVPSSASDEERQAIMDAGGLLT